ncbi:alpha/beta fold hydrolase [Novosphingobium pentaromativorans]|uniref:Putative 3-oxoadipate enol-lactone hydrolase n=1 Tax=Novosphingobium pentaromativorans US6-1 TaxID=1088721 RepID=G6E7U6_9SPHN|nr:alpha/beta fold hydrolase [Novosphingobium pentaromativorans]AIT81530.1 3-oxoadipate enol-lactone hydrolase [Novosphingobium pentaromativorans US6-1]EHJ62589.1 putative 3-oxoadipate enol-lactone hydrolase [Novosphingobium pentaromativorans US6-1]
MPFEPFTVEARGAALRGVRRDGEGVPLVLIHGFGASHRDWQDLIDELPPELALIAYDQRGFGDSPAPTDAAYSHGEDLLALLDALELERVDLCGMSLGGATALNFALDHPDRVRRLILVSPLMVGWSWSSEWIERWKQIGRAARSGDMAGARALWWQHPLFESTRASAAAPVLKASIEAFHGQQWVQDNQRHAPPDLDRLDKLAMPTLLLTGGLDTEDFRRIGDAIASCGTGATRIDYADAGHMLNFEIPGRIARDIADFLSD